MHPLTPSLADLSDDEVLQKITDLQNKRSVAYRMANHSLVQQIEMILEDHLVVYQDRQKKMMEELQQTIDKLGKK